MSEIKVGDWIEVLKGVTLYPYVYPPQGRKTTAMVKGVITDRIALAGMLQSQDECMAVQRLVQSRPVGSSWDEANDKAYAKMGDAILARYADRPQVMVTWGDGYTAFIDDVRKVDAPKEKAPKPPTKMQKMVPKSVWRVTETIEIKIPISNPAHRAAYDKLYHAYMRSPKTTAQDHGKAHQDYQDALKNITLPQNIDLPYVRIEAGTELTVAGKRATYHYYGNSNYVGNSPVYPFKVPKTGVTWLTPPQAASHNHNQITTDVLAIPYDLIGHVLEEGVVPLVKVYVLRDRETGQFFKEAQQKWRGADAGLLMVDTFQHARKYDDLGRLKSSVIDWTGYAHGMPESHDDDRPVWMNGGGEKIADFPSTWEVLVYDKLNKVELPQDEPIAIQDWYTRLWQMRGLTIDHGTVVRKLYNDLDKKGEVEEFSYILALRCPLDEHGNYPRGFTEEEVAAFEDVVTRSGLKRTDMRRGKHPHSMAVAVRDPNMAFQMRFTYGGSLPIAVLNLRTLEEEVRGPQSD